MSTIASQITSLTIVYSTVYSDADQRKHVSSVSLAFLRGIRRGPVNSPHNWPVTRKMFPFDDVIMPECIAAHVKRKKTFVCDGKPIIPKLIKYGNFISPLKMGDFKNVKTAGALNRLVNSLRPSNAYIYIYNMYITIIGSDNGFPLGRHQAIIWINAGILLIRSSGANYSEILIKIYIFLLKKMHLKCCQEIGSQFASASIWK